MSTDPKIIVALDYASADEALVMAKQLDPQLCRLKVGKELFTAAGPAVVTQLQDLGFQIFLDLKFHDIPNTVAKACQAAARLGVWMLSLHTSGGLRMLQAAQDAVQIFAQSPLLVGVTVLTSFVEEELRAIGIERTLPEQVQLLAQLADQASLAGLVCSAQEVQKMRADFPRKILVTPGIRLENRLNDDQRRVATPTQALQQGASYLVIGRPITQSSQPAIQLKNIVSEIMQF